MATNITNAVIDNLYKTALNAGATTVSSLVNTGTSDLRGAISNSTGNLNITDNTDITGDLTLVGAASDLAGVEPSGGLAFSMGAMADFAPNEV